LTDRSATPWHPVALSIDVPVGVTRAVILEDREIVLWRGADGAVHAWDDRCPHRGMRLSYGFVRGGSLNCLYHGWEYEGSSRCVRIPAHPDLEVPKTIRATAYAVRDAGGLVWMNLDPSPATEPPDTPSAVPLITTAINRSINEVRAALGESSGAIVVRDGLVVALHAASEEKTLLHALGVGIVDDAASRRAGAAAVRALRRQVETVAREAA
jgi:nitrite reductase/ring-hydroxylating ferredoxin subunit